MKSVKKRLEALREEMRREGLGAFIFPSMDPHQSEYVADHWKGREWISGFNGSAGTAVVTLTSAALWTDSRYFRVDWLGAFVWLFFAERSIPRVWHSSQHGGGYRRNVFVGLDGKGPYR